MGVLRAGCAGCQACWGGASGLALRRVRIGQRHLAVTLTCRDEAGRHGLVEQHRGRERPALDDDIVAGAAVQDVQSAATDQHVVTRTARQRVVAGAADQDVVAVAAIGDELDAAVQAGGRDDVVAIEAVDDDPVARAGIGDVDVLAKPRHRDDAVVLGHRDDVVAAGSVDGHRIRGAVIGAEVEVDLVHAGAGEVADGNVVGTTEGIEVDMLDAVQVHRDGSDIAREQHPAAIGRDVDVLVDIGAVEQQRVGALAAFDSVAAVAGIPDEGVIAGAEIGEIVAASAVRQCHCRHCR